MIAALTGARYGVMINDLATGAANDVGILKAGWVKQCLHQFEYSAYRKAAGAVVLCEGFKRALVAERYPADRIWIVRSPVDIHLIKPLTAGGGTAFRHDCGLKPTDFVVLFAGSMGLKQGLENVVEAAQILSSENKQFKWLLVGDGETRIEIGRKIEQLFLADFIKLIPFQPEANMSDMFAAADILLLNQLSAVKDTVIPSKLLTYMSAGRPVLAAVNAASQGAELLLEAGGGRVIPPENPAALALAVKAMSTEPERLLKMGRANRAFAVDNFDQNKIMKQLENFVLHISPPPSAV
jgi:colanic acid biosynthesis glycosyl transferase WcaI